MDGAGSVVAGQDPGNGGEVLVMDGEEAGYLEWAFPGDIEEDGDGEAGGNNMKGVSTPFSF
ncbi:hypothetical protein AS158_02820 [Thermotoga sp. 38H-to]|nr:hypothetical protein AS158_02820 [Thermotoga sp. 38H-to]